MKENTPNEKIADKIKKLLALANGNTTEGEATLAMQKVQELLDSYNLSMAEVDQLNVNKSKTMDGGERKKSTVEKSAMYKFQRELMAAIAESYFCLHWVASKYKYNKAGRSFQVKYHVLVGREANVVTANMMFDYLNTTIEKLAQELYPCPLNLSKSAISWKEGCAHRLAHRLRERKYEQERLDAERVNKARAAEPTSNLPALRDVRQNESDANYDLIFGYEPGTFAARHATALAKPVEVTVDTRTAKEKEADEKRSQKNWEKWQRQQDKKWANKDMYAYQAGSERGEHIGLDQQVNNSEKGRMI